MSDKDEPGLLLSGSPVKDDSNMMLFGALAAVGVGLLIYSKKKKDEKEELKSEKDSDSKELPSAKANQVAFSSDLSSYEIGSSWLDNTLDPYLEEMVESVTLATPEWKTKGPLGWVVTDENIDTMMKETREKVLGAFFISHFVTVNNAQKTIASLENTQAVQHFKSLLDAHTKEFQEEY